MSARPSAALKAERKRLMEWLESRASDGEGDCLLWKQAINGAGIPVGRVYGTGPVRSMRAWVWEAWHGEKLGSRRVVATCWRARCLCIDHLEAMSPGDVNRAAGSAGMYSTPAVTLSRRATARSVSKLRNGMDSAREIRARHGAGETATAIAADHGVSISVVSRIVRGESWKDGGNPWQGLMR